jgi:DNA-binding SARP family transcriptional activator/predicted ATPase
VHVVFSFRSIYNSRITSKRFSIVFVRFHRTAMDDELQLFVLGRPRVQRNGQPLADLVSAKAQALLIYLACTGKTCSRSALAGLLWGDMPEETARANLRLTLTKLRKTVGDYLAITWQDVAFDTRQPYRMDAADFLARALKPEQWTAEQLRAALDLYGGDFLDDFYVQDAPEFEDWALAERERLRQIAFVAWWRLAGEYRRRGAHGEGVEATRQALALDPWHEEAHQQLMWLLAESGQRSAALAQYEVCRHTLTEELGVEPAPATVALYERIKRETGAIDFLLPPLAEPATRMLAHNLPAALTPLVGRAAERVQIAERFANPACRLLTLIGPGGIGKTRLALAAAEELARAFRDGVVFVTLAGGAAFEAGEAADLLVASIADALDYRFAAQQPPRELLLHYLADKALLLVLDNMEQLRAAGKLLAELLRRAPNVKLLVTSRERLGVAGEWLYEVEGLSYAPTDDSAAPSDYPAFALFAQGAQRIRSNFDPSTEAAAISRICQLVEGSPLGLELAARWVQVLSCAEIVARLEHSLDLLNATTASADDRHRSIRVVLDDSWNVLTADEQRAFRHLSVFQGGFDLAAAEQIAGAAPPTLAGLADKSWLRRDADGRYRIHELLRQYGAEQLAAHPGQAAIRRQHAQYYADFLAAHQRSLVDRTDSMSLAAVDPEIENLRVAWDWSLGHMAIDAIAAFLESLWRYYQRKGWLAEAAGAIERALRLASVPDLQRGRWQLWLGEAYYQIGRIAESEEHLAHALSLLGQPLPRTQASWALRLLRHVARQAAHRFWPAIGAPRDASQAQRLLDASAALAHLGPIAYQSGEALQTMTMAFWSLNLAEKADSSSELARAFSGCCITIGSIPLHRPAERYGQLARAAARASGDPATEAYALEITALYLLGVGCWSEAEAMLGQACALYARLELRRGEIEALSLLAKLHAFRGQFGQARQTHTAALALSQQQGDPAGQHWSLLGLADCALPTNQAQLPEVAAWLDRAATIQHTRSLARADVIRWYGTAALVRSRGGDFERAAENAQIGVRMLERNALAGVWTMEGFAGLAETYLSLWEAHDNGQRISIERDILTASARKACSAFQTFARSFPIAQPRMWLYQGWRSRLAGDLARANRAWQRSLSLAEQLAMPYEQGRAHFELGRHAAGHERGQAHLRQAADCFATLGTEYDEIRATRALEHLRS